MGDIRERQERITENTEEKREHRGLGCGEGERQERITENTEGSEALREGEAV
jgi:hypothetical protein